MFQERHTKFTQKSIGQFSPPESGRITYFDTLLPGFGCRVGAPRRNGHVPRTFVAFYRVKGKLVMETIGKAVLLPVEVARARARESMLRAIDGANPVEERRKNAVESIPPAKDPSLLVPAVIDAYLDAYKKGKGRNGKLRRPRTVETEKAILNLLKKWQPYKIENEVEVEDGPNWRDRYIDELTADDVERYCETKADEGHEVAANRALAAMKRLFKWARKKKKLAVVSIEDLPTPYPEAARDRWLKDAEIRAFWWACNQMGYPYGPIYQLLLLTAARLTEVAHLPAKHEIDIDGRLWTLPAKRTKSDRTFLIPLTDPMIDIFNSLPRFGDSEFMFVGERGAVVSGFGKAKAKLDKLMVTYLIREGLIASAEELDDWVIHDLRHTARTNLPRVKIATDIAERLLNHKIPGVRGLYDHWEYFDEKKEALERWSDLVKSIVSGK